jgi:hypothetical protein
MTTTHLRPYRLSPRPFHRESTHSYTTRVLTANFETPEHQQQLITENSAAKRANERDAVWDRLLAARTKRPLRLDGNENGWLDHADRTSCETCAAGLRWRTACTLCAQGAVITQNKHFDDLVCIRHRRWVGLETPADEQHPVTDREVTAAMTFRRLRRRHRIDVRLFALVTSTITRKPGHPGRTLEAETFADAIAVISAITDDTFARKFFSPSTSFEKSFALLKETLAFATGFEQPALARALWLYARPTFCDIRQSILTGQAYQKTWAHDYPLNPTVGRDHAAYTGPLEPFANFLTVTGDTALSATRSGIDNQRLVPTTEGLPGSKRAIFTICARGHRLTMGHTPKHAGRERTLPACKICRGKIVIPGDNDLATTDPRIAAEFDPDRNGGLTAADVYASSKDTYNWLCPAQGHSYPATVSNRTKAKSKCPVCLNRLIIPGVNDLTTTHPHIAAEFHPSELSRNPPTKFSYGSNRLIVWLCPNEHVYSARIFDRIKGKGCPDCTRRATAASKDNLTVTDTHLAAEWHPTMNGDRRPEHFSRGSRETVTWLCPVGHHYPQRIERRAAGYKCSVCSRRKLVPSVNDLATTEPILVKEWHPFLNHPKTPDRIFAGTELYWWKCLAAGHKVQQSVPHRVKSKGCTECVPDERILARSRQS